VTLKALLFDLDNTLAPEMANYERAFTAACRDAARRHSFDSENFRAAVFAVADELWRESETFEYCARLGIGSPTSLLSDFPGERPEFAKLRRWAPVYRARCWTSALRPLVDGPVEGLAAELDAAFRAELEGHCPAYDDAVAALDRVAPFYSLAVLTNGPGDVQRLKLRASGLERYFPVVVASGEIGFGKPDRRMFTTALDRLGLSADEVITIGDSLERDVVGAHNAGLRCIWLNREAGARPHSVKPQYEIASLNALASLLLEVTQGGRAS